MRITLIGAGRVASHLGPALHTAGHRIEQVYSRTRTHAARLADALGAEAVDRPEALRPDADGYLCALSDDALVAVLDRAFAGQCQPPLLVHTAGSLPLDVLAPYTNRYAVLYPLQTFSPDRTLDLKTLPLFVEASDPETLHTVTELAGQLSEVVRPLDSEKRLTLHLAAVFACNFVNHLYGIAGGLLEAQGLEFDLLLPLIDETAAKVHALAPRSAQTGPALRNDRQVMAKHLQALSHYPELATLYNLISEHIQSTHQ